MATARGGKSRGRPPLPEGRAKRYAVGIRTTKHLKDFLQQAADEAGRSVAQRSSFGSNRPIATRRPMRIAAAWCACC